MCNTYEENPVIVGNLEDDSDILNISGINRAAHIILATNDDSINMRLPRTSSNFCSERVNGVAQRSGFRD